MADRFPSLEDFDENIHGEDNQVPEDGGSFLDRERAILGDEANQFAQPGDQFTSTVEDGGDDDLLGGGGNYEAQGGDEISGFESSFPAVDSNDLGGTTSSYPPPQALVEDEEEPDVIKDWREKRSRDIETRDKVSEEKTKTTTEEAQQAINDFYDNFNDKKEKNIAQVRREAEEFLNSRDDTTAGGTSWERIAKLVDLSGKGSKGGAAGTGKERFREILLSLRKDEKAPGASGY